MLVCSGGRSLCAAAQSNAAAGQLVTPSNDRCCAVSRHLVLSTHSLSGFRSVAWSLGASWFRYNSQKTHFYMLYRYVLIFIQFDFSAENPKMNAKGKKDLVNIFEY
jgi:hypothetical protein